MRGEDGKGGITRIDVQGVRDKTRESYDPRIASEVNPLNIPETVRMVLWGWDIDPTKETPEGVHVPGVYEKSEEKFLQIVAIRDRLLDVRAGDTGIERGFDDVEVVGVL